MSKKHFFLFDFLLPLAAIFLIGKFLASEFDTTLFVRLDRIKPFGFGAFFSHSPLRSLLWEYSWAIFAAVPALLWLIWVRINLEYDYVIQGRRLDRPLYGFFKGLLRWVDGDDGSRWALQSAEFRVSQAEDRARKLESELMRTRQEVADLEKENEDLHDELQENFSDESEADEDLAYKANANE